MNVMIECEIFIVEFCLIVMDCCDLCGVQVYIVVEVNGFEFLFCVYYGCKYEEKFCVIVISWYDEIV